jgi:hypothetical protein
MTLLFLLFLLTACTSTPGRFDTPQAKGHYIDAPMQCVPYARKVSGIPIYGDAHTWWTQATYKGRTPRPGAVLVLAKTGKLRHGHLAVVKQVLGPRKMMVTHTNWGSDNLTRRAVYDSMLVEDISKAGDWSLLRFWNKDISAFGLPYPAYGFVYK